MRESESRARHLVEELKRSNADLERFAYVSSHDLQEPLRMVTTYMQLIERRYKDVLDAKAREYMGYAVGGAIRMRMLIEDLLTYSRVGSRAPQLAEVDSSTIVNQAIANLQRVIDETGAQISADSLPIVRCDARQLCLVFQNLLSNALKYRSNRPPQVQIRGTQTESELIFSVQDNGIGIEAEYFTRIFIIFQRLHPPDQYPGSGIGLSVCKKIVERHGGRIWLESTIGSGSTFYFSLPT